jgi:pimeloyl-ACP methyl ester carboxylesterase
MLDEIEMSGEVSSRLLDAIVPLFFRRNADASSTLCTTFRASLGKLSAQALRDGIVPLGRITFGRRDIRARLPELNAQSTLILCGAEDIPRPPSETREMAELIGCPFVTVPEAGHISNLENPAFVNEALLSFLAAHCGGI